MAGLGSPQVSKPYVPTSEIIERLIQEAPPGQVSLAWLMSHLQRRSFGIILLLIGVCGMLPVVSPAAGLMLTIPAFQMIRAHPAPVFPTRIAERSVATDKLAAVLGRVIPMLRYLEHFVRPRWPTPFETTKRVIGGAVLLLGICLLAPFPLSNIPPGLTIVLVAFAYLEEDGILLALSLVITFGLLTAAAVTFWSTVAATIWMAG